MSTHDYESNGAIDDRATPAEAEGPDREAKDDDRAQRVLEFVREVVSKMGMSATVSLHEPQIETPLEIHLEISGPDSARIIGKKGQVLAALQYLANRVINRPGLERRYVIVDSEGYHARREETLSTMAKRLGKKAMTEGKIITFEPMSARDRRIVHMALADLEGVVTKSDGEGESRRVQIIPVRR